MSVLVFDGLTRARERERVLAQRVRELRFRPRLMTVVFVEDEASSLYTRLKQEAAVRVGIEFDRMDVMFADEVVRVAELIKQANSRVDIQGVMVQKPSKVVWQEMNKGRIAGDFDLWWKTMANAIDPAKDVDCLSDESLSHVYAGHWKVLPATVKAVLLILGEALGLDVGALTICSSDQMLGGKVITVVGRSDIVGRPLAAVLEQRGAKVNLLGSNTTDLGQYTCSSQVIVSATGVGGLIKEDIVPEGCVVIDVGSPKGDVDFDAVKEKARFITPVPDGVGPMTVVSLLENLVEIS